MTFEGHVENGQIVLHHPAPLPEGVKVRVELLPTDAATTPGAAELPTLYERYRSVIGKAAGLPSDFAENHDHYIHGAPKQ